MSLLIGVVGAIVSGAIAVSKALAVAGLALNGLRVIANSIISIAKSLGIIRPEKSVEEIGDRALQAEENGIKPEDCGSYEAWVKKIESDDWGYDPKKNSEMDPEKKIAKGVEVSAGVAIEKFKDLPIQDFLMLSATHPEFFTVERMEEISKLAVSDEKAFGDILNYVTGADMDRKAVHSAVEHLIDIQKTIDQGISDAEAYDIIAPFYAMK